MTHAAQGLFSFLEYFMTALVVWALRLVVLFVIIRIAVSLFLKKSGLSGRGPRAAGRFDAKGKSVEDGDFKDL